MGREKDWWVFGGSQRFWGRDGSGGGVAIVMSLRLVLCPRYSSPPTNNLPSFLDLEFVPRLLPRQTRSLSTRNSYPCSFFLLQTILS